MTWITLAIVFGPLLFIFMLPEHHEAVPVFQPKRRKKGYRIRRTL